MNVSDAFIGADATHPSIKVASGATVVIDPSASGLSHDLSQYYLRGAVGDGVVIEIEESAA